MAYITCKNLAVGYEGKAVSEHIDFCVNAGDYLCIVGENGAGKSTLMKTLLHLISPVGGQLIYEQMNAHDIGYLPQQTVVQRDFPASVMEIVLSGNVSKIGFSPFFGRREKERARKNMERMNIWNLRKKCYRNLSGGQQQRVLLARALCATTNLLVLDEPVAGLDPKVTAEFYELIANLNKEGMTILMVSHDMQAAMQYASHILHVGKRDKFFGTKEQYLQSDIWKNLENELEENQSNSLKKLEEKLEENQGSSLKKTEEKLEENQGNGLKNSEHELEETKNELLHATRKAV